MLPTDVREARYEVSQVRVANVNNAFRRARRGLHADITPDPTAACCQNGAMNPPPTEVNRTKIRAGLAIIGVLFLGCLIGAAAVSDPTGRIVLLAVAAVLLVRLALLTRSLRREARSA